MKIKLMFKQTELFKIGHQPFDLLRYIVQLNHIFTAR